MTRSVGVRRGLIAATCATVLASLVTTLPAGAARSGDLPRLCAEEQAGAQQWGSDLSRLAGDGVLTLDSRVITVRGESAQWRQWDLTDPAFSTSFHSLSWLVPGMRQGLPVVDILLEREAAIPDPGYLAGSIALKETGWTAGIIRLRMGTVACMYAVTGDERLGPVMDRLVAANLDPYRYRGAPVNKPHNQGTLANVALLEAARVFDRPEWREPAIRRFEADAGTIFDRCGMTAEQSTSYHRLNVNLWRRSLAQVGAEVDAGVDMGAVVHQAALATWKLTRPDGILEAIGTGNRTVITPADLGLDDDTELPTRLYCGDLGWAANRSSWDDTATHYVLRFGPRPARHGHEDRGALTWFTQGVPVFSDRGVFDRSRGERWRWAHSAQAHSTFHGIGTKWRRPFTAEYARVGDADTYRVETRYRDTSLEREFTIPLPVDDTESVLHVTDVGRTTYDRQWYQRWQLAEGWTPLARTTAWEPAAVHEETGLYLYGSCRSAHYMRMSVTPVETFPAWRVARPASSLDCGGLGRVVKLETLWVVSPVEGMLTWDALTGEYAVVPPQPVLPIDPIGPIDPVDPVPPAG
jgi:hypothetical protein